MDFDLKSARKDIAKAKAQIESGFKITKFKFLDDGNEGTVFKKETAVIKRYETLLSNDYLILLHERSLKGLDMNIKFAPILDTLKKGLSYYSFMPFLEGPTLAECSLEDLHNIGQNGFEQFFADIVKLHNIELCPDLNREDNLILTHNKNRKSHLSHIDFRVHNSKIGVKDSLYMGLDLIETKVYGSRKSELREEILQTLKKAYNQIK